MVFKFRKKENLQKVNNKLYNKRTVADNDASQWRGRGYKASVKRESITVQGYKVYIDPKSYNIKNDRRINLKTGQYNPDVIRKKTTKKSKVMKGAVK